MSRYDGLIIPRSYSEYINKTDAATIQQALQLPGVLSGAVAAEDNKAVKSSAVYEALAEYINKTDAATIQQALQLPGVLSGAVAAEDNKAVKSSAVNNALAALKANNIYNYSNINEEGVYIYLFTGSDSWDPNSIDYIKVLEKRFNFAPSLIEFSYTNYDLGHFRYNFNEILKRDENYGNKIIITNNYKVYLKIVGYSCGRIETNKVLQMEEYTALPTGETEQYIL